MAEGRAAVRVSARPPPRFSEDGYFVLWVQRFELYLEEAKVPPAKRVRELVSLLDDRPFSYVSQLGLLTSDSYETVRSELRKQYFPVADETEWQFRFAVPPTEEWRNLGRVRWRTAHARGQSVP